MKSNGKIHMTWSKEKGLQTVMTLLLLLFCAGSGLLWGRRLLPQDTEVAGTLEQEEGVLSDGEKTTSVGKQGTGGDVNETQPDTDGQADRTVTGHVVLDAGHGAEDGGKVGINKVLEKDINLAIVLELQAQLEAEGIQVTLTRPDDTPLYEEGSSNKKMSDMKKRIAIITEAGADVLVSIHQNSYTEPSVKGPQVFYYKDSSTGEQLAGCIQNRFTDLLGEENRRQVKANKDYYLLIHTPIPAVIVECGFLSNPEEAEKLSDEGYQKQVAQVICHGILDYLGEK